MNVIPAIYPFALILKKKLFGLVEVYQIIKTPIIASINPSPIIFSASISESRNGINSNSQWWQD